MCRLAPKLSQGDPLSTGFKKVVLFWMDTPCISAPDECSGSLMKLRLRAIKHTAPVYAGAMELLILNSELAKVETRFSIQSLAKNGEIVAYALSLPWNSQCKVRAG